MCASGEPLLLVYDTVTHHVVRRYSHLTGRVYGVRASRDGQRLFSAADRVHGWSLDDAPDEPLFEFADHRDNAFGVDESPDGTQLATAGTDGTVRIFPWRELTAAARGAGDETGDSLGN
jgi:WD40 repeat protein